MTKKEKKPKPSRAERRAERKFRKGRHRLAMATVYFNDHTYKTQVVDLNRNPKTVEIEGKEYNIPEIPLKLVGWWPFRVRSFKRAVFKDEYYAIDWREGEANPVSLVGAHIAAEHKMILPSTFAGMLRESMYSNMLLSMKKKNAIGLDNKMLVIILAVIGVGAFVAMYMMGVI